MQQSSIETTNDNKSLSFGYETLEETCSSIEHLRGEYDQAIVVLCGGITEAYEDSWKTQYISRMRMIAGAMEYHNTPEEGNKPIVIISGGIKALKVTDGLTSSAIIRSELIELGVSENDILLEEFSLDTSQNAQNTSKILKVLGFDEKGMVKLITNGFHLKRAQNLFKRNFDGNLQPRAAERVMIDFGEGKLPNQKFNRRYGEFAKRYSSSSKNKRLIIKDSIIRGISDFPGGQEVLTNVAKRSRTP